MLRQLSKHFHSGPEYRFVGFVRQEHLEAPLRRHVLQPDAIHNCTPRAANFAAGTTNALVHCRIVAMSKRIVGSQSGTVRGCLLTQGANGSKQAGKGGFAPWRRGMRPHARALTSTIPIVLLNLLYQVMDESSYA